MAKKAREESIVEILQIEKAQATFHILGTAPGLLCNRMPKKVREYLLLPPRRQNKAALEAVQKHNPPAEFRDSVYRCRDDNAPTLCHLPDNAFKKAMAQAALDIPGATKAAIGRLVSIVDSTVHLYGVPCLHMGIVKQAGMTRAPDVRTRALFKRWACQITISYIPRLIAIGDISRLLAAAGLITGVGDGRQEKGSSSYGCWEIVEPSNAEYRQIIKEGGRKAQVAALANPEAADLDTEELLSWYETEIVKRSEQPERRKDKEIAAAGERRNGRRRQHVANGRRSGNGKRHEVRAAR